ncbi:MAG: hypothetical protein J6R85_03450, partial [Lentisphaeria bacterium]|nr:hypothetical protein [Lentisphaeria bacterium]
MTTVVPSDHSFIENGALHRPAGQYKARPARQGCIPPGGRNRAVPDGHGTIRNYSLPVDAGKFLHKGNESIHTFHGHGVVDA